MLDRDRLYVWAWDTRPYPEFPLKRKLWSDGDNWSTGHWLNGRVSGVALDELIAAILTDFGFSSFDTSAVDGFVSGYVIDEPASVRSAIEPLLALYGVDAFESGNRLIFQSAARMNAQAPLIAEFVEREKDGAITWRLQEMLEQPARVELGYRDPNAGLSGGHGLFGKEPSRKQCSPRRKGLPLFSWTSRLSRQA